MSGENLIYDIEIIMTPESGGESHIFEKVDKWGPSPHLTQLIFLNGEETFVNMHHVQMMNKKNIRKENISKIVTLT
jgi:hypothetical protein